MQEDKIIIQTFRHYKDCIHHDCDQFYELNTIYTSLKEYKHNYFN